MSKQPASRWNEYSWGFTLISRMGRSDVIELLSWIIPGWEMAGKPAVAGVFLRCSGLCPRG